jgi:hypothetical protein
VTELAAALGVTEGPQLLFEVTELVRAAQMTVPGAGKTVLGAAPLVTQAAAPVALPHGAGSTGNQGQVAPMPPAVMSSTSPASPGFAPAMSPPAPMAPVTGNVALMATSAAPLVRTTAPSSSSGPKLAVVLGAVVLLALLGGAAFFGLRRSPGPDSGTANQEAPASTIALPTSQAATPVPADPPAQPDTAPPQPAPSATGTEEGAMEQQPAAQPTSKSNPSSTQNRAAGTSGPRLNMNKKKPSDDDLMSGRR